MPPKRYLIDTSVLIDASRRFESAVKFLDSLPQTLISVVTAAELFQGCRNKRELQIVENFLKNCQIIPTTPEVSLQALDLVRNFFLKRSLLVDDALIAATAIERNLILVTKDTKHFHLLSRLQGINHVGFMPSS